MGPYKTLACILGSTLVLSSTFAQIADPALYTSIASGGVEELKSYLSSGGNPSARINVPNATTSMALLDVAVRSTREEPALVLLTSGARPDAPTEFVEVAAERGFAGVLGYMLDRDPSLVFQMRTENHPLFLAIARGHLDAVSTLLDRMKPLGNAQREPILNEALSIATNSYELASGPAIVRKLLDAGADAVSTPVLAGAVSACASDLVSTLLAAGSDAKRRYDIGSGPVLLAQYAVRCFERAPDAAESILRELASAGADLCSIDWADSKMSERSARRPEIEIENCR
jgi:hypothetical protein